MKYYYTASNHFNSVGSPIMSYCLLKSNYRVKKAPYCLSRSCHSLFKAQSFLYSLTHTTSLALQVVISLSPVNSRMISTGVSPSCFWINLLPSWVMTVLQFTPSILFSSNSSPSLNSITEFLKVETVLTTTVPSPLTLISIVGVVFTATLRITKLTSVQSRFRG